MSAARGSASLSSTLTTARTESAEKSIRKLPGGTGRVRVQSGSGGAFIRNLFYTVVEDPVGLAVMPDYSGNGFEELAVLGTSAGTRHVQILDTSSGSQVNRIDFP